MYRAADLGKAESVFFIPEQFDQLRKHTYPNPNSLPPWYTTKAASHATTV